MSIGATMTDTGSASPTNPQSTSLGLNPVLERNIEVLSRRQQQDNERASLQDRVADSITRFTGSMLFVYLHIALFGGWIIANLGWIPWISIWDPSFVVLAMWASVEAIFLSTFVLISQNRMAAQAEKRANLDLQISLLSEHEITKIAELLDAVAKRLDVMTETDRELQEIQEDIAPEAVLDKIEQAQSGK